MSLRAFRLAAALAVVAVCPAPFAGAAPCARYARAAWVTVAAPDFPAGPQAITDYAVAGRDPDRVYVTNGAVVMSSADGGCTWQESLRQLDLPVLGATPRITHLAMAANDANLVWAALGSDNASRPGVVRTTDGGKTWQAADGGLAAIQGRPLQLAIAPSRGDVAYLVVEGNRVSQGDTSAEVARSLFRTDNGGGTWEERRASPLLVGGPGQQVGPVRVGGNGSFEGVAVDPRNSDFVWLYGGFGLWVSKDGADTSAQVVSQFEQSGGGPVGHVDLYHSVDVSRVVAFGSTKNHAWASFDGGVKFFRTGTPGIVRSSASGRRFSELLVATDTQVLYQQSAEAPPRQITPKGPSVRDVAVSVGTVPVFYARTTAALLRWTAPADPPLKGDTPPPAELPDDPTKAVIPQLPPIAAPALTGPGVVELTAGERRTVPYTLDLPGVQRADVYFLVDVSESMAQEINGLRSALAGIVTDLVVSRIDAHFGVARYNTYNTEPYFRVTPVIPPGPAVATALEQLTGSAGGTQKSQLEAVFQSVTGRGASHESLGTIVSPGTSFHIPPGQEAGFRPEAPVKLVLNITDEPFYEDEPSPAYATVGAALRAAGVQQIGLALDNGDVLPTTGPGPEAGLRTLAAESGALAPEGGVDCDGDATPDIEAGEPLVCVMPSERSAEATLLANAIVNLVRSIPNRGALEFGVAGGGPRARLNRTSFDVDFKQSIQRSVEVTYACPAVSVPEAYRYDVRASAGGALLAALPTTLRCAPRTTETPPVVRGALPPVAGAAAPAPQPPSSQGNANPNMNPNPQSQPQSQAQLGSAMEPEEQDQLQGATVDVRDDDAFDIEELAMSRRPDPVPVPVWLGGAALLTSAAAFGLRTRTRVRTRVRPAGR